MGNAQTAYQRAEASLPLERAEAIRVIAENEENVRKLIVARTNEISVNIFKKRNKYGSELRKSLVTRDSGRIYVYNSGHAHGESL